MMLQPAWFLFASLGFTLTVGESCFSSVGHVADEWCNLNCNHQPPFCPADICYCGTSAGHQPLICIGTSPATGDWCEEVCSISTFCPGSLCDCHSTSVNATSTSCRAVAIPATDSWCTDNCRAGFCPPSFCNCPAPGSPAPGSAALAPFSLDTCCSNTAGSSLFILGQQSLQKLPLPVGVAAPTLCASFLSPQALAIDSQGNIFVADSIAGTISRVSADCSRVQLVTSWSTDGIVGNPQALAIHGNGLYVADAATNKILLLTLDSNFHVASVEDTHISNQAVTALSIAEGSGLLFVVESRKILSFNLATKTRAEFLNSPQIVDISGIHASSSCGIFFTANDNDQVWHCADLANGASCSSYCVPSGLNSVSCELLQSPFGVTADCNCHAFVTNNGNGKIVEYDPTEQTGFGVAAREIFGGTSLRGTALFTAGTCSGAVATSPSPSPTAGFKVRPFLNQECCPDHSTTLFFTNAGDVRTASVRGHPPRLVSGPSDCAQFVHAVDIEVDEDGGFFVADDAAAAIFHVSNDCSVVTTVTTWARDQLVGNPESISIHNGGLIVADRGRQIVWFLALNSDFSVRAAVDTGISNQLVQGMTLNYDSNNLYFIEHGREIIRFDLATRTRQVFMSNPAVVDISDLEVSSNCGLFFTANDNNQVWRCPNLFDGSTCQPYCILSGQDATTCQFTQSPFGLALDCCDLYSTNSGNGNILFYNGNTTNVFGIPASIVFNDHQSVNQVGDIEVFIPGQGCSQTSSPTPTPSATPSPTSTRTPTATSTRSPSSSPIASSTQTPTSTSSRSSSSTATPSSSPTATPVTVRLNTVFVTGTTTGGASQGNQQSSTRAFEAGHGLIMAIALLRVSGSTLLFERFISMNELGIPSPELNMRIYSSVAKLNIKSCFRIAAINTADAFLQTRLLQFFQSLGVLNPPTDLSTVTQTAMILAEDQIQCVSVTGTQNSGSIRFTWGLTWSSTLRPCVTTTINGFAGTVSACLEPFGINNVGADPILGDPADTVFQTFSGFRSNLVSGSNAGTLTTTSQVQSTASLFSQCTLSAQSTVFSSTCASAQTNRETFSPYKTDFFCRSASNPFLNSCRFNQGNGVTNDGCFCDECCFRSNDCCPDMSFCTQSVLIPPGTCATAPLSTACATICGA
eukprot:c20772_g1_i1.p1 GENE.c20772_g1_i1~~c20772_g1_i1.p1  ORF type:complete len:1154 (+),score=192.43 c20772_g1_i1:28-3462(+)